MKRPTNNITTVGGAGIALGVLAGPIAGAQEKNFGDLAARIVKTSAQVNPGVVVVISGGKHNVAVMEELAIQAAKAGGFTFPIVNATVTIDGQTVVRDGKLTL